MNLRDNQEGPLQMCRSGIETMMKEQNALNGPQTAENSTRPETIDQQ